MVSTGRATRGATGIPGSRGLQGTPQQEQQQVVGSTGSKPDVCTLVIFSSRRTGSAMITLANGLTSPTDCAALRAWPL